MDLAIGIGLIDPGMKVTEDIRALDDTGFAQDAEPLQVIGGLTQVAGEWPLVMVVEGVELTLSDRPLAESGQRNVHEPLAVHGPTGDVHHLGIPELLGPRERLGQLREHHDLVLQEREGDTGALSKLPELLVLKCLFEGGTTGSVSIGDGGEIDEANVHQYTPLGRIQVSLVILFS